MGFFRDLLRSILSTYLSAVTLTIIFLNIFIEIKVLSVVSWVATCLRCSHHDDYHVRQFHWRCYDKFVNLPNLDAQRNSFVTNLSRSIPLLFNVSIPSLCWTVYTSLTFWMLVTIIIPLHSSVYLQVTRVHVSSMIVSFHILIILTFLLSFCLSCVLRYVV